MPKFLVEGTYRHDHAHEHGELHPLKFCFTVSAEDKIQARHAAENELRHNDTAFDSIRTLTAKEISVEQDKKNCSTISGTKNGTHARRRRNDRINRKVLL